MGGWEVNVWGFLIMVLILLPWVTFAQGLITHYFEGISAWALFPLLFALTKLSGDLFISLLWPNSTWLFLHNFAKDTFSFIVLGFFAALALHMAQRHIGGTVPPNILAVLAYILLLNLTQREQRPYY